MADIHPLGNAALPLERKQVEALLDAVVTIQGQCAAIAGYLLTRMDEQDGDADFETTDAEDDFAVRESRQCDGPGCEISDPAGQCDEDDRNTAFGLTPEIASPGCSISDPGEYEDGV